MDDFVQQHVCVSCPSPDAVAVLVVAEHLPIGIGGPVSEPRRHRWQLNCGREIRVVEIRRAWRRRLLPELEVWHLVPPFAGGKPRAPRQDDLPDRPHTNPLRRLKPLGHSAPPLTVSGSQNPSAADSVRAKRNYPGTPSLSSGSAPDDNASFDRTAGRGIVTP